MTADGAVFELRYGDRPPTPHCPIHVDNPTTMTWGISGALYGNVTGCGTGFAATRAGILAKVTERATDKGWTDKDYVLVFADWSK